MPDFVRQALKSLSGNHFKLWACLLEYRESLTLQQFADNTALDLATVKRILPDLVGPEYLARDDSKRPHRYSLASQLCLRFDDSAPKSQNALFRNNAESQDASFSSSKVAIYDSLYLMPPTGIESILDTESDRSHESRKMPLSATKWRPDNEAAWRTMNEDLAKQTAQMVGDRASSYRWHVHLWQHVRRTDAIHKTNIQAHLFALAAELKEEREKSGLLQGATFNARANKLLTRAGFPLGRKEKDDREILAVPSQTELSIADADPGTAADQRRATSG